MASTELADNVRGALDTIDKNDELITMTLAVMMAPERQSARAELHRDSKGVRQSTQGQ